MNAVGDLWFFFFPNARSANKCFTYILQRMFYMNLLFLSPHTTAASLPFSLCRWISAGVGFGECYVFVTLFIRPSLTFSQIHRCCVCNKSTPDEPRVTHPVCQRMALWPRLPLHWRCKKGSSEIFCSQRLSITVHWECVSVGRVNPDIFRKVKRVKFLRKRMWRRRQKHGNSGTHPAALAAPSVNCCLETKQLSSFFFFVPLSFHCGCKTYNFHYVCF